MMFPTIDNIRKVWPLVKDKKEFRLVENEEYGISTICYFITTSSKTQFDTPISRECRGIKFSLATGDILARPFHKFFNKGEIPEEEPNPTIPFTIWDKLDGSMVHPIITPNKGLKLCTKMGITNISLEAESLLTKELTFKLTYLLTQGITPIFEYTSPTNRIVLKYEEPKLTLLALRDNISGNYLNNLEEYAYELGVGIPQKYSNNISIDSIKHWENKEGVVIVYPNGFRLKVKTEDYVFFHKFIKSITQEKSILKLTLNEELDDILPFLPLEDRSSIEEYTSHLFQSISYTQDEIANLIEEMKGVTRKDIALELQDRVKKGELNKIKSSLFWSIYNGEDSYEVIKKTLLKANTSSKIEDLRWLIPYKLTL